MKVLELLEAVKKEKYDHLADTDAEGKFKSDFKPRKYDEVYDDVKRVIFKFVIGRMRGDRREDAEFIANETDDFHSDYLHDVTSKLRKRGDLNNIVDDAMNAVEEIIGLMKRRYGKVHGGSSLHSMIGDGAGSKALQKKIEKRTGGDPLDMESGRNFDAFLKALESVPEYAEATQYTKWLVAKQEAHYAAKNKEEAKAHATPEGFEKATAAFDKFFDKAINMAAVKNVQKWSMGGYSDWGFTEDNLPKTVEDLVNTVKSKHGIAGIVEWVSSNEYGFSQIWYHIRKNKKAMQHLVANSKKLEKYK